MLREITQEPITHRSVLKEYFMQISKIILKIFPTKNVMLAGNNHIPALIKETTLHLRDIKETALHLETTLQHQ